MDPRYALFIWTCFGAAAIAVLWNVIAPALARNQLRQRLSDALEAAADADKEESP